MEIITITPEMDAAWRDALAEASTDLDLTDGEDRATFRQRVSDLASQTRTPLLRTLAVHFGATAVPTSHAAAARALAQTQIGA